MKEMIWWLKTMLQKFLFSKQFENTQNNPSHFPSWIRSTLLLRDSSKIWLPKTRSKEVRLHHGSLILSNKQNTVSCQIRKINRRDTHTSAKWKSIWTLWSSFPISYRRRSIKPSAARFGIERLSSKVEKNSLQSTQQYEIEDQKSKIQHNNTTASKKNNTLNLRSNLLQVSLNANKWRHDNTAKDFENWFLKIKRENWKPTTYYEPNKTRL